MSTAIFLSNTKAEVSGYAYLNEDIDPHREERWAHFTIVPLESDGTSVGYHLATDLNLSESVVRSLHALLGGFIEQFDADSTERAE